MQAEISAPLEKSAPKTHFAVPHLVLAAIGIALSIAAIWAKTRIEAGMPSGCGITETISCDEVIGSKRWGQFFGVPLGYYGLLFWTIVGITAISSAGVNLKNAALQRLGVATVGLIFSAFLFTIAEFVIGKTCPICLSTHFCSLLNFIFAVVGWRRINQMKTPESI